MEGQQVETQGCNKVGSMKMNNIGRFSTVFIFVALAMLLSISSVSAVELNPFATVKDSTKTISDNLGNYVKEDFNPKYGVITLSSTFLWIGTGKTAEYSLTKNTEYCIMDCEAEGRVTLYSDGVLFDDVKFKTLTGRDSTIKSYSYFVLKGYQDNYVDVPDTYKTTCIDMKDKPELCSQEVVTYKKENHPIELWDAYNGEMLKAGDYRWKIEGVKEQDQSVDFIPVKDGKDFSEWATWTASFNTGLKGYYTFDEPTGTLFSSSVTAANNLTMNNSHAVGILGNCYNITSTTKSNTGLPAYASMTVNAWIRFQKNYYPLGNADAGATNGDWRWVSQPTNNFGFYVYDGVSEKNINGAQTQNPNAWEMFTMVVNSTSLCEYRNGTFKSCTPMTNWAGNAKNLTVGMATNTPNGMYIDELGVWNRTLSTDEIINLWNNGTGITYSAGGIPKINIVYPTNNSNSSINSIAINYTISGTLDSCWWSNNSWATNTSLVCGSNITGQTWKQGTSTVFIGANDTTGIINQTSVTFFIDSINPNIAITYPSNNTNYASNNININYSVADSGSGIGSCWWSNNSWATNTSLASCTNITGQTWKEGTSTVFIGVNDTLGNLNQSSVTFSIDSISPNIIITYPSNDTTYTKNNININYSVADSGLGISNCWYSNDSMNINITLLNCINITTVTWVDGTHNVIVWVNDTAGNINKSMITFSIETVVPTVTLGAPPDGYFSIGNTNNIYFNCSAQSIKLATNLSFWDNSSGVWKLNQTYEYSFTKPMSYWSFDDGSGTNIADSTQNHNLTYPTGQTWIPGKIGNAFLDDGGYANGSQTNINLTDQTDFSISFWMNKSGSETDGGIFTFDDCGANGEFEILITNEHINVCNGGAYTLSGWYPRTSQWEHYVVVRNATFMTTYVNGVLNETLALPDIKFTSSSGMPGFFLFVGGLGTGSVLNNVALDEMVVWNKTISQDDVERLYNLGAGINYATLTNPNLTYFTNPYVNQKFSWTCSACNNVGCGFAPENRSINVYTKVPTYNNTAYETSKELFIMNYSAMTSAVLVYDGVRYITTVNNYVSTYYLNVPSTGNKSFYWEINGGSDNSSVYTQVVNPISFGLCNYSASNLTYINLTFKDETTLASMNATLDYSSWNYSLGGNPKIYLFSNTTHNPSYSFCLSPPLPSILTSAVLQYSSTQGGTYNQRRITLSETLFNNTVLQKPLYLLSSTDGMLSNYQVITVGNQVIEGAYIKITRVIDGNVTFIADGITDASGQVSFFLNQNYDHTFTVTASGFATQVITIKPSQSQYTITMGTKSNPFLYVSYPIEGLAYSKWPPSGIVSDGMYNFTFQVWNSLTPNIYNCTFNIYYPNNTLLVRAFGCNTSTGYGGYGGKINAMVNMTPISQIYGEYFITLPCNSSNCTGFIDYYIERDARWKNVHYESNGIGSGLGIIATIQDLIKLPEWGDCPGGYTLNATDDLCYDRYGNTLLKGQTTDFSKIVFFFLLLAIVLAILNFYTGYDTAYPGAFLYLVTGMVFIGSLVNGVGGPGFFYLNGATNHKFFGSFASIIDNWILFVHFFLISAIYFFTTNKRYQSG